MEQRRDDPSEEASDSVEESSAPADETSLSFVERHFWPLLVGVVLIAAGASTTVVYLQYGQVHRTLQSVPYADRAAQLATSIPPVDQVTEALPYVSSTDSSDGEAETPREYGSFTRMKGLVVNPARSNGDRYLAVSLAFESKSSSVEQELKDKKVVVRDAVLNLLSEQTVEELSTPDHRDELKDALLKETNRILSDGTVDRLYFTEFVLQ